MTLVYAPQGVRDDPLRPILLLLLFFSLKSERDFHIFLCCVRGPSSKTHCSGSGETSGQQFPAAITVRQRPCVAAQASAKATGQTGGQSLLAPVQVSLYCTEKRIVTMGIYTHFINYTVLVISCRYDCREKSQLLCVFINKQQPDVWLSLVKAVVSS